MFVIKISKNFFFQIFLIAILNFFQIFHFFLIYYIFVQSLDTIFQGDIANSINSRIHHIILKIPHELLPSTTGILQKL